MTCIVAIAQDGKVSMGADSEMSDTDDNVILQKKRPKIFLNGEYLVGYAGSARFGLIMEHNFIYPKVPARVKDSELEVFLNKTFVPKLRKHVIEVIKADKEECGEFVCLIGLRGHIFELDEDWAIFELDKNYTAIGSGTSVAMGALYATSSWTSPQKRLESALGAATEFTAGVGKPFNFLEV
jgi:ATP-dependent protease HslVU (ClpYQ) peptidase subunit